MNDNITRHSKQCDGGTVLCLDSTISGIIFFFFFTGKEVKVLIGYSVISTSYFKTISDFSTSPETVLVWQRGGIQRGIVCCYCCTQSVDWIGRGVLCSILWYGVEISESHLAVRAGKV